MQKDLYIPDGTVTDEILKQLIWDAVLPTARQTLIAWEPESRINEPVLLRLEKHTVIYSHYPHENRIYYNVVFRSSIHRASKIRYQKYFNTSEPYAPEIMAYNYANVDTATGLLR